MRLIFGYAVIYRKIYTDFWVLIDITASVPGCSVVPSNINWSCAHKVLSNLIILYLLRFVIIYHVATYGKTITTQYYDTYRICVVTVAILPTWCTRFHSLIRIDSTMSTTTRAIILLLFICVDTDSIQNEFIVMCSACKLYVNIIMSKHVYSMPAYIIIILCTVHRKNSGAQWSNR